jgi:hypothetical protein
LFSFAPAIIIFLLFGIHYCSGKTFGRFFLAKWSDACLGRDATAEDGNITLYSAIAVAIVLFVLLSFFIYMATTFCLLIIGFVDVCYLPIEAYKVAPWANNFQHIL